MQSDPQSLENRALCAVARVVPDARFVELLDRDGERIDWELLVESAYQHGITGLLCQHLVNAPEDLVPDEMVHAAREHLKQRAESNQAIADQLCPVIEGLSSRRWPRSSDSVGGKAFYTAYILDN